MDPRLPALVRLRRDPRFAGAAVAFIVALAIFGLVAHDVVSGGRLAAIDVGVARWMHAHATPTLIVAMLLVTQAHSTVAVSAYGVLALALLWTQRALANACTVFAAVAGVLAVNAAVKLAFHRPRPAFDDPVITLPTYSFPSGHVAASTVFYGLLLAWAFRHVRGAAGRVALVCAVVAAIVLVALSRMLLGVHYLSDTVGACAEGAAWLALCLGARAAWEARSPAPQDGGAARLAPGERHG